MATTDRTRSTRALAAAALLSTAGVLSGCAGTEEPGSGAGSEGTTTSSEPAGTAAGTAGPGRASETASTDLGPYTAQVRKDLAARAGQRVRLTGEVAELIPSRSALVLTDPADPEADPLLVTARYTFSGAEEGTVVEITGTVREDFAAPVAEEDDEDTGFYDRHLGEPYLDEAEVSATAPTGS